MKFYVTRVTELRGVLKPELQRGDDELSEVGNEKGEKGKASPDQPLQEI